MQHKELFDDKHYNDYRKPDKVLEKSMLFNELVNDINMYVLECIQNNKVHDNVIYIGYELFSRMDLTPKKMSEILNLLLQHVNPDLYVKSLWKIIEVGNINNVELHKIQIKMIVYQNDKNLAIKRFAKGFLHNLYDENKKIRDYLQK